MGYFKANTLWRDSCYYLDTTTGECKPKYVLILATSQSGNEALVAVLTSKANGLREVPACDPGPPRAGYYIGVPGSGLNQPTWVDFSSIRVEDDLRFKKLAVSKQMSAEALVLPTSQFCGVLRCLSRSEDIENKYQKWISQMISVLGCP